MWRAFYRLAKPGIIYSNLLTAAAGFFLGSTRHPDLKLLLWTLIGLGLVIGAAAVCNNLIDIEIDRKMPRTKDRELVTGVISKKAAAVYAAVLGLCGFAILFFLVNFLTALVVLFAVFVYLAVYSPLKPKTSWAALIGSAAGAVPPAAGFAAAANHLGPAAWILFLSLAFWQMPHFYAISIYRQEDYAAAGVPVLPLKSGILAAKINIVLFTILFLAAVGALKYFGYAGYPYLFVVGGLGLIWLILGLSGFGAADDKRWARKMFFFSLLIILAFSVMVGVSRFV